MSTRLTILANAYASTEYDGEHRHQLRSAHVWLVVGLAEGETSPWDNGAEGSQRTATIGAWCSSEGGEMTREDGSR